MNPFGQARVALGLTKVDLARRIPCSKSCVLYNEEGLYSAPIPVITQFFVDCGYEADVLRRGYYAFQRSQRRANNRVWLLPPVDLTTDPLRAAIRHNNFSITGFCKSFCLQPVLLHQPKTMGPLMEKVFLAAGFTPVQVDELKERLEEYVDHGRLRIQRHGLASSDVRGTDILRDRGDADSRIDFGETEPAA